MKTKAMIAAAAVSAASLLTLVSGCNPNEALLVTGANTAGNLGLSAWFAIDDPDADVKATLKDVVTLVGDGAAQIGAGGSYVEAITPAVQDVIARRDDLTSAQKNLINAGAAVMLGALDTFIDANPEVKGNAALASKVIAAFCQGCLSALSRSEGDAATKALKRAHEVRQMRYSARAKAFIAK